jgi:YHS domain-containing protein
MEYSDRGNDRYTMVVHMSDFIWCHGTCCHKSKTMDRVRGSKGSKVLRTRKVKQETERSWYDPNHVYNYFCSQTCLHDFIRTHIQRIVALDPRTMPLETPIDDPKPKENGSYYYSYNRINTKEVDNA